MRTRAYRTTYVESRIEEPMSRKVVYAMALLLSMHSASPCVGQTSPFAGDSAIRPVAYEIIDASTAPAPLPSEPSSWINTPRSACCTVFGAHGPLQTELYLR